MGFRTNLQKCIRCIKAFKNPVKIDKVPKGIQKKLNEMDQNWLES